MLQLIAPNVSNVEKHIRSLGVASLPSGDTFWYEDIPQIPARLSTQYFMVHTSELGKQHTLTLNGKDQVFIPDSEVYPLGLALQQGIYDYELKTDTTSISGAFQISLKELIFWTWIQRMIPTFSNLEIQESLINTLGNEFLFELIYPNEILNFSKTPYSLKSFISSGNENSPSRGLLGFASALMNKPIKGVSYSGDLVSSQDDYSKITLPLPYETISRKKSFSTQHHSDEFESITSDSIKIKEVDRRQFEPIPIDFSSKLLINSYVPNERYRPSDFRFRLVTTESQNFNVLKFPEITSYISSKSYVNYGDFIELTPVFLNGLGEINGVSVESGSTYKFYPVTQTDYTLSVTNSVGSPTTKTLTIGVGTNPVINYFDLDVSTIEYGGSAVLTSIFGGQDTIGSLNEGLTYIASGNTTTVFPTSTTTYTLTITNGDTTLSKSVTLNVLPEQISFLPSRTRILKGTVSLLTANFIGSIANIPGIGNVKSGLPFTVSPQATTTYNLEVDGVTVASAFVEVVEDNDGVSYKGMLTENIQVESSFIGVDSPNFSEWSLYAKLNETIDDISQDNQGVVSCVGHGLNTGQKIVFKNDNVSYRVQNIVRGSTTTVTAENHTYTTGDKVKIKHVVGMTEINDQVLEVLSNSGDNFVLDVNSSSYSLYLSGGTVSLGMEELNETIYTVAFVSEDEFSFSETESIEIINIDQNNPARITTSDNHGFTTGDKVILYNIKGMKALNGAIVTVTEVDDTNFDTDIDTSDDDTYSVFTDTAYALKLVDTTDFTTFNQGNISLFITKGFGSRQVNVDDFIEGKLNDVILLAEPLNLATSLDNVYDVEYTEGYTGNGYGGKLHIQTSINPTGTFVNNFYVENSGNKYKTGEYISFAVPSYMGISSITKANPGIVTCSTPHQLKTGDRVKFINLVGMTQLNNNTYTITRTSSTQFQLNDINTSGYGTYTPGSGILQVFIDAVISSVIQRPEDLDLTFFASQAVLMNNDSSVPVTLSFYQKPIEITRKVKSVHQFENESVEFTNLTLVGEFLITDETLLLNRGISKLALVEPVKLNVVYGEHKVIDFYWKIAPTIIDVESDSMINWNLYANAIDSEVDTIEELESDVVHITVETARTPIITNPPDSVITRDGNATTPLSIEIEIAAANERPVSGSKIFYQWYKDGSGVGSEIKTTASYNTSISAITKANPGVVTCATHGFSTGDIVTLSGIAGMTELNSQTVTVTVPLKSISGITKANPGQITSTGHGFSNGNVVALSEITGMLELNGQTVTVTVINANAFTIGVNTTDYTTYTSGGFASNVNTFTIGVNTTAYTTYTSGGSVNWNTSTYDYGISGKASSTNNGNYYCIVTNTVNQKSISATSNQANVFSVNRPTVTALSNKEAYVGGAIGIKVAATGNANLTYQWQKGVSKVVTGITRASSAVVTCTSHGFSNGEIVTFDSISGMTALSGLSGTVTYIGASSFSVNIDTSDTSVFGSFISGNVMKTSNVSNTTATTDRLFISAIITGDAGTYLCKVKNTKSSYNLERSSNFFTLTTSVADGPVFTLQPQNISFSTLGTYEFNSLAENIGSGTGTITYQWYKNNSIIPNAVKKDLRITASALGVQDNGSFYCIATNANGSTQSQTATLTYIPALVSPQPLIYESFPPVVVNSLTISPAVNGKTTWDLTVDGNLVLSSSGAWTVTPTGGNCNVRAKIWGAAGGAGGLDTITNSTYNDQNSDSALGGGGGYIEGYINLLNTTPYTLKVGGGGKKGTDNAAGTGGGAGGYNGGGAGGNAGPSNKSGAGGGGAGRTEILNGSTAYAIVGGGAGGAGEGLYDSTGTYRSLSTIADKTLNDGNRSLGYQNISGGGNALNKSGDGGGNGGGGSGWLGGNGAYTYTNGDANGFGGGAGSTDYNPTYFILETGAKFNPLVSSSNSAGQNYSGWNSTAGQGGFSDGKDGLIIIEPSAAARFGTSLTVVEGKKAVLVINDGVAEPETTYQWYYGTQSSGTLISFTSSPIYTISTTLLSSAGNYYCLITKGASVKSKLVTLSICAIPKITTQPSNGTGTVTLSVVANGNGTLSYQWYKNGTLIVGSTSASLISPAAGSYYCVVTNTLNGVVASKQSDSANVTSTSGLGDCNCKGTLNSLCYCIARCTYGQNYEFALVGDTVDSCGMTWDGNNWRFDL